MSNFSKSTVDYLWEPLSCKRDWTLGIYGVISDLLALGIHSEGDILESNQGWCGFH